MVDMDPAYHQLQVKRNHHLLLLPPAELKCFSKTNAGFRLSIPIDITEVLGMWTNQSTPSSATS